MRPHKDSCLHMPELCHTIALRHGSHMSQRCSLWRATLQDLPGVGITHLSKAEGCNPCSILANHAYTTHPVAGSLLFSIKDAPCEGCVAWEGTHTQHTLLLRGSSFHILVVLLPCRSNCHRPEGLLFTDANVCLTPRHLECSWSTRCTLCCWIGDTS